MASKTEPVVVNIAAFLASAERHRVGPCPPTLKEITQRFWSYVNKGGPVQPHCPELGNCWEWIGGLFTNGYGQFRVLNHKLKAHRVSSELAHGALSPGIRVLHRCDNKRCVRPDHLDRGTLSANSRDREGKGRSNRKPLPVMRGENNPNAKFTWAIVEAIREASSRGLSNKQIAEIFGIPHTTVSGITLRKSWRVMCPQQSNG